MLELEIRARIRAMIETGQLPCDEPEATWAGTGEGKRCAACAEAILSTEFEFEVDFRGRSLRLHRLCHAIWLEECAPSPAE
jgi:hypothetical protein